MDRSSLNGKFIGIQENLNTFTVVKKFKIDSINSAELKITALGLYFAVINGQRVGDSYLTPGWTNYNKQLQVQRYDITGLLKKGKNIIEITVNEGWYAGPLSWNWKKNCFGKQPAVCADIVCDGCVITSTDKTWNAFTSPIISAGIYNGETVDFTAKTEALTLCKVFNKSVLVEQICESIKNTERLPVRKIIHTPNGEVVYDFGQNIAGVAEITTPENFDGTIKMSFAELLVDGNFYTGNLGGAKQTDTVTGKGKFTYAPEFTFHGFRYMKLEGCELPVENVCALARHTDLKRTGYIRTSNDRLNRLISNIVWGQRSNFVDIPSDCPQRSERLGWTGDINVFCNTAAFNYDIRNFMKKWLADFVATQAKNGEMPRVCPDVLGETDASALWADTVVHVPYKLYKIYGDISYLEDNYGAIKKFISAHDKNFRDGLIKRGYEFGDWLAMDGEELAGTETEGRTDKYFIANVLFLNTLRTAAQIADVLGNPDDSNEYLKQSKKLLKSIRDEYFTTNGRLAVETVTAKVLALFFNAVPEKYRQKLAIELNEQVIKYNYRAVTGFVGTPYLLNALADNGYLDTACKVLLNVGYPGWLYEVDMGATTVWERWNSILPDGTPNPNGMNSCNHYAYGSVEEFIFSRIAGLNAAEAGYKKVDIAPNPCSEIAEIKAEYQSVNGRIIAGYKQGNGKITYFADIPDGVLADIVLPNEDIVASGCGNFEFVRECNDLAVSHFGIKSSLSEIFLNPKAMKAFNETFGKYLVKPEVDFLRKTHYDLNFILKYLQDKQRITSDEFYSQLKKLNEIYLKL